MLKINKISNSIGQNTVRELLQTSFLINVNSLFLLCNFIYKVFVENKWD